MQLTGPRWALSGLCARWEELWGWGGVVLSLQTLLTVKGAPQAGWTWATLVCLGAGAQADTKRTMQVAFFLIGVGLFPLLSQLWRQEQHSCPRDHNGSLPCLPFVCLGKQAQGSALPCLSFSWEYFVQRLGQA